MEIPLEWHEGWSGLIMCIYNTQLTKKNSLGICCCSFRKALALLLYFSKE